jgi:hypothetical protein
MRETIYLHNLKRGNLEVDGMIKKRGMKMWPRFDCLRRGSSNGYVVIFSALFTVQSVIAVF